MDALRMLEFPRESFDLVNQRFGQPYLRSWEWAGLLQEFRRVTRPDGIIRITDCDMPVSNAPAFGALQQLFGKAMNQSGHLFSTQSDGITSVLEPMMHQAGLLNLRTRVHHLEYRAGTKAGQLYTENIGHLFRTAAPFLRKWTKVPGDYDRLYHQTLEEMQQPDFVATWPLLTVWGTSPQTEKRQVFDPH
jgi:ubiquinone/menaquinone biosynthesis C-methylase UbiE